MNYPTQHLHVLHTESIYSRGGEKYLFELLKRVKHTHVVHLYLHRISPHWHNQYRKNNISVSLLWTPPRLFWLLLPITLFINFLQLKKTIKKTDVLFATNFPMNFLSVLITSRAICHCFEPLAIFYDPIRISSLSPFSRFCVAVAKLLYAPLDRWAYAKSAVLTALGPSVEPYIIETYGRKPDLYLPNGVDSRVFSYAAPRVSAANRSPFILGHSTDYTIFKGTEDFLSIIAHLKKNGHTVFARISESIPDKETKKKYMTYIRRHALEHIVEFVGTVSERRLPEFYRSLDFFIYTGSPECAGGSTASLSVLEAQSCGTPVIRSRGDDHEIIDGVTGYYIDPHNHKESGKILARALRLSKNEKNKMREASRKYIYSRFDWDITGNILVQAIQQLEI
jgi:glycosyltransferase involved in cell wall biosynthesis